MPSRLFYSKNNCIYSGTWEHFDVCYDMGQGT